MQNRKVVIFALSLLILLLAAFTRFHLLGAQSLWNDEGSSYVQATRSFGDIAANAARDIHPPGYYWLLAVWRVLLGESEFSLRALSTFASLFTVAFTYAIGRQLFGRWIGLLAAAFVTLNTFSIYYAQEARMYALLSMWAAGSMWALLKLIKSITQRSKGTETPALFSLLALGERARVGAFLLLALFNAAGLYTHYAYPFVMLAQGVLFVLWCAASIVRVKRDHMQVILQAIGIYCAANLLTLLLFLPLLPTALQQVTTWPNTGEAVNTAEGLRAIFGWFAFGITFEASGATMLLFAVLFLLLFGLVVRHSQPENPSVGIRRIKSLQLMPSWLAMLIPLLWVVIPVGLFLSLGLFRPANLKFLLPAQIGFALWLARGVGVLWASPVRDRAKLLKVMPRIAAVGGAAALLIYMLGGLPHLYSNTIFQRANYRGIAALISANPRSGDAIILDAPNQEEVFRYYYQGQAPIFALPAGLGGDDTATRASVEQIITSHDRIFVLFWGEAERDPNRVVESTLDALAFEADNTWYGDVRLVRYAAPAEFTVFTDSGAQFGDHITLTSFALSAENIQAGDVLQLRLIWTTNAPIDQRYKIFIHLLDENGSIVAQRDSEPVGGSRPTTDWQAGEMVEDNHALLIPNNLPPSHYSLIIGLYDSANPQMRLQVSSADSDHLTLSTLSLP